MWCHGELTYISMPLIHIVNTVYARQPAGSSLLSLRHKNSLPVFVWGTKIREQTYCLNQHCPHETCMSSQINILNVLLSKCLNIKPIKWSKVQSKQPVHMQDRVCVWTVRQFVDVDVQYLLYMGSRWHYRWPLCVSSCPLAEPQREGALIWSNWAVG